MAIFNAFSHCIFEISRDKANIIILQYVVFLGFLLTLKHMSLTDHEWTFTSYWRWQKRWPWTLVSNDMRFVRIFAGFCRQRRYCKVLSSTFGVYS